MDSFDWFTFLRQLSKNVLESDTDVEQLSLILNESGLLGYPGANEQKILQAESRLGKDFPPSYRAFLKVSNGWRILDEFMHPLFPVEDIDCFADKHRDWIETWTENTVRPISDEGYFVYGPSQDAVNIRREYLKTALQISPAIDESVYLLNPCVVSMDGEWEAWFFADWMAGADRYRSFQEMMTSRFSLDLNS